MQMTSRLSWGPRKPRVHLIHKVTEPEPQQPGNIPVGGCAVGNELLGSPMCI